MNTTESSIVAANGSHTKVVNHEKNISSRGRLSEPASVLPYIPRKRQERSGLLIEYLFTPAAPQGTDYLDFLLLGESRFGVILADLCTTIPEDHVQEAIPLLKLALRSKSAGLSAAATLRYLDQHLTEHTGEDGLITALYLIFDQSKRLLHYASAGHLPMLLHRSSENKTFLLTASGAPIGHDADGARSTATANGINKIAGESVALAQGDLIILYNSGLLKQRNRNGDYWGRQRLIDCLRKYADLDPASLLAELKRRLEDFVEGEPQEHDVAIIALKNTLRDLEKPGAETFEHATGNRFLTVDDEEIILEAIRENPDSPFAKVADELALEALRHLKKEKVLSYLTQTSHWLTQWPDNVSTRRNGVENHTGSNGQIVSKAPAVRRTVNVVKQLQQDMLAAFPIRQVLARKYEFTDITPGFSRALEFYTSGDYQQALFDVLKTRQDLPASVDLHCFVGNLYLLLNMTAEAREEYQQALAIDQRTPHAHLALSYIALVEEDFYNAIDEYSTALRLDKCLQGNNPLLQQLIAAVEKRDNRSEWLV
jgi:hypothetical protein